MPPRVILIGPPGAGKSSVGKSLARLLSEKFVDTDTVIAEQEKQSIGEIFVDKGEPYFRQIEEEVLIKQLEEHIESNNVLMELSSQIKFNKQIQQINDELDSRINECNDKLDQLEPIRLFLKEEHEVIRLQLKELNLHFLMQK